jgi:hypothetical protein
VDRLPVLVLSDDAVVGQVVADPPDGGGHDDVELLADPSAQGLDRGREFSVVLGIITIMHWLRVARFVNRAVAAAQANLKVSGYSRTESRNRVNKAGTG